MRRRRHASRCAPRAARLTFTLVGIVQSPTQRPFLYAPSVGARHADPRRRQGRAPDDPHRDGRAPAFERDTGDGGARHARPGAGCEVSRHADPERDQARRSTPCSTTMLHVRVGDGAAAGRRRRAGPRRDDDDERRRAVAGDRRHARDRGARPGRAGRVPGRGAADRVPRLADRRRGLAADLQGPVRRAGRVVRPAAARVHAGDRRHPAVAARRRDPGARRDASCPRGGRRGSPCARCSRTSERSRLRADRRIMAPSRHEAPR